MDASVVVDGDKMVISALHLTLRARHESHDGPSLCLLLFVDEEQEEDVDPLVDEMVVVVDFGVATGVGCCCCWKLECAISGVVGDEKYELIEEADEANEGTEDDLELD